MKRNWTAARAKVRDEGICRFCGTTQGLQACHVIPRSRISAAGGEAEDPLNIVVLCARDHALQHAGLLELLPLLTLPEQGYVAGLVGIEEARLRTTNRELAA